MVTFIPDESHEMHEADAARRQLLQAGAENLPRMPWSPGNISPDDATLLRFAMWRANSTVGEASHDEIHAALALLKSAHSDLEALESGLILIARGEGMTWAEIAQDLGFKTPQAAQQRFQRVSDRVDSSNHTGPTE